MTTKSLSVLALTFGLALLVAASASAAGQRMLITGQIEVVGEDLHGDAKIVELVSDELGRFRVATDRKGDELLKHAGAWVSVFGEVQVENGIRIVHVDGFRVLPMNSRLDRGSELAY